MYSIFLFLHIVGALGIFAGMAIEQAALINLRRARTISQASEWLSLSRGLQRFAGPSALALLATGVYMMVTRWSHQAWAGLGLVGMILLALIGALVTGRRMKPIGQALLSGDASGPLPTTVRERLADPALRLSAWVRLGLALGIVFNMSVKPGTTGAVAALLVGSAIGALAAQLAGGFSRPMRRPAAQE
ncbi:MAG TPA: hypothetical protein VGQ44_02290 [Gemmatimonadaceae bacterium]|jgi:hypothetical protein|nr:hypothetical protein [Gemmatimonadaceae bacterium]